jgi:hypothetical protein
VLAKHDTIIVWVCKGTRCHQHNKKKKKVLVGCPRIFFVYNESRIFNFLQQMAKQHVTTLKLEAYSMGKQTNVIWRDDWDAKYFVDNSTNMSFGKLIHDMYDPNPKAQIIVQHLMHKLMGPPYNWTTPKECH